MELTQVRLSTGLLQVILGRVVRRFIFVSLWFNPFIFGFSPGLVQGLFHDLVLLT